jgi:hypothetical protein
VSSHLPPFPAAAGGKKENWKALPYFIRSWTSYNQYVKFTQAYSSRLLSQLSFALLISFRNNKHLISQESQVLEISMEGVA